MYRLADLRSDLCRRLFATILLFVGSAVALPAWADPVKTQVLVVLASTEGSVVDPALKKIEALQKAPFNSFSSMKILEKPVLRPDVGKPAELKLPNGRTMQVAVIEVLKDARYRLKVSINKPNTSDYLPGMEVIASPGEPFFVAGQKYEGGTLVIGVQVGSK